MPRERSLLRMGIVRYCPCRVRRSVRRTRLLRKRSPTAGLGYSLWNEFTGNHCLAVHRSCGRPLAKREVHVFMPVLLDTPIPVSGLSYIVASTHRRLPNQHKSLWGVGPEDEIECFRGAHANGWCGASEGWGVLRSPTGAVRRLGTSVHGDAIQIAKFVSTSPVWHGYPADHRRNPQDRPATGVLAKWLRAGIIGKPQMRRLTKGQPCIL